jgi:hypothetical protein
VKQGEFARLLAEFALDNHERALSEVTVLEFAKWYQERDAWERLQASANAWEAAWRE